MDNLIRISGVVKESIVDGPGLRYVVFTQGCPHKCAGCHNPQTHDISCGKAISIDQLVEDIHSNPILKGVTISGGEPFLQANQINSLLSKLDRNKLDVIVYTGFEFEYLINNSNSYNGYKSLIENADILIDGKYDMTLKSDMLPFRGSTNQRSIDCKLSLTESNVILHSF